jgi:hypothetical protein
MAGMKRQARAGVPGAKRGPKPAGRTASAGQGFAAKGPAKGRPSRDGDRDPDRGAERGPKRGRSVKDNALPRSSKAAFLARQQARLESAAGHCP